MRWTIKLVFEAIPGSPVEHEVGRIERAEEISPATVGLTLAEGKALLASLQEKIVTAQVQQHVANIKPCPRCGKSFRTKGNCQIGAYENKRVNSAPNSNFGAYSARMTHLSHTRKCRAPGVQIIFCRGSAEDIHLPGGLRCTPGFRAAKGHSKGEAIG
jgi:hypothetical protein